MTGFAREPEAPMWSWPSVPELHRHSHWPDDVGGGMTLTTAKELGPRNITCNAVAPGFIETDMTAVLSEKVKAAAEAQIPMKKMGKPEDVAAAVAFLASDAARYITGQVLSVDGGLNM